MSDAVYDKLRMVIQTKRYMDNPLQPYGVTVQYSVLNPDDTEFHSRMDISDVRVVCDYEIAKAVLDESERKFKKSLWMSRALRASHIACLAFQGEYIPMGDDGNELDWRIMYHKWKKVEELCLKKAREYDV